MIQISYVSSFSEFANNYLFVIIICNKFWKHKEKTPIQMTCIIHLKICTKLTMLQFLFLCPSSALASLLSLQYPFTSYILIVNFSTRVFQILLLCKLAQGSKPSYLFSSTNAHTCAYRVIFATCNFCRSTLANTFAPCRICLEIVLDIWISPSF